MGYDAKLDQAANIINDSTAFGDPELVDADVQPELERQPPGASAGVHEASKPQPEPGSGA